VSGSAVTHSAAHDASLSPTSRTDRDGYVIAALSGELGIASAPALREQLRSLLRAASQLIIDLSAVERAEGSGLAVLVGSGRHARLLGGSLRLAAPSPEVARVLSATGLNQHLDIYPTVRAAITGQPRLPDAIFPPTTVPARGRIDGVIAARLHNRLCLPLTWRTTPAQVPLNRALAGQKPAACPACPPYPRAFCDRLATSKWRRAPTALGRRRIGNKEVPR
jgi:anti-anti-sigma factor